MTINRDYHAQDMRSKHYTGTQRANLRKKHSVPAEVIVHELMSIGGPNFVALQ